MTDVRCISAILVSTSLYSGGHVPSLLETFNIDRLLYERDLQVSSVASHSLDAKTYRDVPATRTSVVSRNADNSNPNFVPQIH